MQPLPRLLITILMCLTLAAIPFVGFLADAATGDGRARSAARPHLRRTERDRRSGAAQIKRGNR